MGLTVLKYIILLVFQELENLVPQIYFSFCRDRLQSVGSSDPQSRQFAALPTLLCLNRATTTECT